LTTHLDSLEELLTSHLEAVIGRFTGLMEEAETRLGSVETVLDTVSGNALSMLEQKYLSELRSNLDGATSDLLGATEVLDSLASSSSGELLGQIGDLVGGMGEVLHSLEPILDVLDSVKDLLT